MKWHLAQTNIGIGRYHYDDPRMAEFVDNLAHINELADNSPGFIWRYEQEDDYEAGREVFGDDTMLFNMSMWESKDVLMDYAYRSEHVRFLRRRAEWFVPCDKPTLALWWQPAGTKPTVVEARHRLELLMQSGPTIDSFTFRHFFDPPEMEAACGG